MLYFSIFKQKVKIPQIQYTKGFVGLTLAGVQGFEPRKCLSQSQVPYRLATPQNVVRNMPRTFDELRLSIQLSAALRRTMRTCAFGWDRWIRTTEMTESKSAALPLGYIPKYQKQETAKLFKRLIYFITLFPPCQQFSAIFVILNKILCINQLIMLHFITVFQRLKKRHLIGKLQRSTDWKPESKPCNLYSQRFQKL